MPKPPNCTGAPLYKGRVDVSITYPSPDETLLDTPIDLPTSEPAEAQISYTLGSQHMPTWSPYELEHVKTAILYAAGENTGSSAVTVYHRILKNGVNVATGSFSVSADRYYSQNHCNFLNVSIGDTLSCKLWAGAAGVNWDASAVLIWPTRIGPKGQVLTNIIAHDYGYTYSLSFAGSMFTGDCSLYPYNNSDLMTSSWQNAGDIVSAIQSHAVYGIARIGYGDRDGSMLASSFVPGSRATCAINRCFKRLSYTPLNLRV